RRYFEEGPVLDGPREPESLAGKFGSAYAEQLDFEYQGRVGRDHAAGAARSVAESRRNRQLALAAHFHALHAFVPALDDAPGAKREDERLVAILARVEFLAVGEPARVMNLDLLAGGSGRAVADDQVVDGEAARCRRGHCLLSS